MKKIELVYREILYSVMERQNRKMTQLGIAAALMISLSTVNLAIKPLVRMNAVRVKKMGFDIIDVKKILYHWASIRDVGKDVMFAARIDEPVKEIEKQMPNEAIFTAFSGYKFKFNDVPADYSEVYVYGGEETVKRFGKQPKSGSPNIFVLKKSSLADKYGKTATTANIFVDLWNLKQWYAKDFLKSLEAKIGRFLE